MRSRILKDVALALMTGALLISLSCGQDETTTRFSQNPYSTFVGYPVQLELRTEKTSKAKSCPFDTGDRQDDPDEIYGASTADSIPMNGSVETWSVSPSEGAAMEGSEFIASEPGTYTVTAVLEKDGGSFETVVEVTGGGEAAVFDNGNPRKVENFGESPTVRFSQPVRITAIETYHYNHGDGTEGGGTIMLKDADGNVYGPWKTETRVGQNDTPNAYWMARPQVELPAGTYTVIDSDPKTWSQNFLTKGYGVVRIYGEKP